MGIRAFALASALLFAARAEACALFGRPSAPIPSIQVENVLVVHDPVARREHFYREIVFRDADAHFGFVVPVPSLPAVARVERPPFERLAELYPPEPVPKSIGVGGLGMVGHGAGLGRGAGNVMVVSVQKVGSFTATVLKATDAAGLAKWLGDNGLAQTPEREAWLRVYVERGFHFVAFRYDPATVTKPNETAGPRSETVRLDFDTPVAFYPYREPLVGAPSEPGPRVLAVWTLSTERLVPVAAVGERFERPWQEGDRFEPPTPAKLESEVPALKGFLPGGALVVQAFEDQKRTRHGYDDVLLVPEVPRALPTGALKAPAGDPAALPVAATSEGISFDHSLRRRLLRGSGERSVALVRLDPPPTVVGGLPREVVQRILRQRMGGFVRCHQEASKGRPVGSGRLSLGFRIDPRGRVREVDVRSATGAAQGADACFARHARTLTFPKPDDGRPVRVTAEFALSPGAAHR